MVTEDAEQRYISVDLLTSHDAAMMVQLSNGSSSSMQLVVAPRLHGVHLLLHSALIKSTYDLTPIECG